MSQYEPDYVLPDINDDTKTKHDINDTVTEIVKETIKKIRKKRTVINKPIRKKQKNNTKNQQKVKGIITTHDGTFKININT